MDNKVVIIGGDHHNTLAIIRNLGKNKVKFSILIHSSNKIKKEDMLITHSKYAKKIEVVNQTEKDILRWLLNNKLFTKQIIIPASDLAEYCIDKNYNKLKDYYIFPGFKNEPGRVVELMDKFEQKKWADKHQIKMAKSWLIELNKNYKIIDNIIYPCIVKPIISANHQKDDITICGNKKMLHACLITKFKKYDRVIVQQFINKKYELLAMGYISDNGYNTFGVERKIRETIPGGGGSTSLGKFIDEPFIIKDINKTIYSLYKEGYRGFFDIEFFECDDGIYLNEINFRHSGSGFALIKNGIEVPYIYYLDCLNINHKNEHIMNHKTGYFFCDLGEYDLLTKYKTINIFQFIFDFIKSYAHSIFDITDLGVFNYKIKTTIAKKLKLKNI